MKEANHDEASTADRTDRWASRAIVLAVWMGSLAALGELALLAIKKFGQHRIIRVSRDVFWMVPLADIALCLGAALVLIALAWRIRRLRTTQWALVFVAAPAVLTILLHYRPLHIAAKVLLALGISWQAGMLLGRRPRLLSRLVQATMLSFRRRANDQPANSGFDLDRRRFLATAAIGLGGVAIGTRAFFRIREATALGSLHGAVPDSPNVLLIVLDTVRAGSLGLYGYAKPTTPQLEQWARRGVVFDRAYSTAPWTLPSHASMFTGRWPHEMSADWDDPLDDADPTLAERLADAGYATAGFVANTSYTTWEFGLGRGFMRWEDYRMTPGQVAASSALGAAIACANRNEPGCRLRGPLHWYELLGRKKASDVRARFSEWQRSIGTDRPFLAFLNFFDAHAPYLPPAPFDSEFAVPAGRANPMHLDLAGWQWTPEAVQAEQAAYDATIASVDAELGRLLTDLDERGVLANTIAIITSDHGEEFREHGVMTHGNSLYSPSLHVPLLVLGPGVPAGIRVAQPVSVRDVAATAADLAGIDAAFPGASLSRFWHDADDTRNGPLHADVSGRTFRPADYPVSRGDMMSVIDGRYHYIRRGDGAAELYDLVEDPWERVDIHDSLNARADSLARLISANFTASK